MNLFNPNSLFFPFSPGIAQTQLCDLNLKNLPFLDGALENRGNDDWTLNFKKKPGKVSLILQFDEIGLRMRRFH
jgi:hypothetical protein